MATPPLLTPIEQLSDGLQRCINEAAEKAAEKAVQGLTPRLDRMEARLDGMEARLDRQAAAIREIRDHVDGRLDRQDETLRMMWKQMTGNGRLPIDT